MTTRTILLAFLIASIFAPRAHPCWGPPREYESLSDSGLRKVVVTPPDEKQGTRSQISVFAKTDTGWHQVWNCKAINSVQAPSALVTDTGDCVVTLGNWYGTDDGDDELVVYRKGKIYSHYSTYELLGTYASPAFHSTAGSEWLDESHAFFLKQRYFCLWVDFRKRWVVVDHTTGKLTEPTPEIEAQCQDHAREDAYRHIRSGKCDTSWYRLLARFLRPEDRPVFAELLTHPMNYLHSGYSGTGRSYELFARSRYRNLAEAALEALDNGETDAIGDTFALAFFARPDPYRHLGNVVMSATFPEAPRKGDGVIVLWLVPTEQEERAPGSERPAHAMGIELEYCAAFRMGQESGPMEMPVRMVIYGVTPGKYRIRGCCDKSIKSLTDIEEDFWKRTGDCVLESKRKVKVRKGKSTKPIRIVFSTKAASDAGRP